MPSVGPNTTIIYANDLARHYAFRQVDGAGVAPELAAGPSGRSGVRLRVPDSAASQSRAAMRYTIKHLRDGDPTSSGSGAQNSGVFDIAIEFEYASSAGLGASKRDRLFALYQAGDTPFLNVSISGSTSVRVFMSGVSAFTATSPVNLLAGVHTIRLYYARSGISGVAPTVRVWVDGTELTLSAGLASHAQTSVVGTFEFATRNEAALAGGESFDKYVYAMRMRFGALADPGAALDFAMLAPGGKPHGLAHWCDVVHDQAKLLVSEFPGRLGYAQTWSRVLWAIGESWPGDGSATSTAAQEHTLTSLYLAHHDIPFGAPANPAHKVMAKVVIQDAESAPTESWTSGVYEVKPIGTAPDAANLARGVDLWALYCSKGFGRGLPDFLDLIRTSADAARDTIGAWIEDEVYTDDREPDEDDALTYPQGVNAPPDYGSTVPAGSAIDIAGSIRMLWESPGFAEFHARFPAMRLSGMSDHIGDNQYRATEWAGSGVVVGGKWGSLTEGEIHNRAMDFCTRVFKPGIIGAPAQGADPHPPLYSAKRIGPILVIGLDTARYAVDNGTYYGAAQLAWARNLAQTTNAKHVVLCSPNAMFDAVYKTGQDAQAFASWRAERTLLLDDFQGNANVQSVVVLVGDAHLLWWYPTPSATHPKVLGEFAAGALSSTMLATQTFVPDIATVLARVTADGRTGWVGPHSGSPGSDTGGEVGDGRHQRRTGRLRYGTDGSLTIEAFSADFNPDDPPSDLEDVLLRTVSLTAFTSVGSLSVTVNAGAVASGGTFDLGDVDAGDLEVVTVQLTASGGDVALGTIAVTGDGSVGASNPSNTTIASGNEATLTINLETGSLGEKTINVSIPSDDAASPYTFTITAEVVGSVSLDAILTAAQGALSAANAAQVAADAANASASSALAAINALNTRVGGLLEAAPSGSGAAERFRPAVVANAPTGGYVPGPGAVEHELIVRDSVTNAPVAGARVWITATESPSASVVLGNLFTDGNGEVRVENGTASGAAMLLLPGDYFRHAVKPGTNLINPQPFTVLEEFGE